MIRGWCGGAVLRERHCGRRAPGRIGTEARVCDADAGAPKHADGWAGGCGRPEGLRPRRHPRVEETLTEEVDGCCGGCRGGHARGGGETIRR